MHKELQRALRKVAAELPRMEYQTMEPHLMTGQEVKECGVADQFEEVEDNQVYEIKSPAYYEWNHYRRMKRIYQREFKISGHDRAYQLVKDYITAVILASKKLHEEDSK